ncbi:MAG: type II toxin-antitoxin system VapC family toxin [Treponema sp.]|nr:type II toxin-antitoxin system VapC family toxin [Treponema sp.]
MKFLLDTHIVLWFFGNVKKLPDKVLGIIMNPKNEKYVSIASAWELAIKINLGKLTFEGGVSNFFSVVEENGFKLLYIKEEHIKQLETLPVFHRDPFDRILIASAICERIKLVTTDDDVMRYGISDY